MPRKHPVLMVVRRNGTMRPARGESIRQWRTPPRFPIIVQFDRGKTVPIGSSLSKLRRCAEWLADHPAEKLAIVGHANERGWARAARALAEARALAVYDLVAWLGGRRSQLLRLGAAQLHRLQLGSTRAERVSRRVVELWRVPRLARPASQASTSKRRAPRRFRIAGGRQSPRSAF